MNDFPDAGDRPDGEAADAGFSSTSFDPLLTPWAEPASRPISPLDLDDSLYISSSPPEAALAGIDDAIAWELPASAVLRPVTSAPSWYPDRYRAPYAERMTELQQRLRAETIVLPRPERRWVVTVRELAETLILALLIFLSVRASFQNFRVEGASMDPSLEDGEYLIVNKLGYAKLDFGIFDWLPFYDSGLNPVHHLWDSPDRGDVIVFAAPTNPERDFIKRIIGLPGDEVEIDEGAHVVRVNGETLSEPYIAGVTNCNGDPDCTWEIPEEGSAEARAECGSDSCYFVMGDNRQNSSDSRQGWLVPEENIVGKALVTYWNHGEPVFDLAPNHSVGIIDEANAEE